MPNKSSAEKAPDLKMPLDVPKEKGFHFNTAVGAYTGVFATSVAQFSRILATVDIRSIHFHMGRKDFEGWIRSMGDNQLAAEVARLGVRKLSGERLRTELLGIIKRDTGEAKARSAVVKGKGR